MNHLLFPLIERKQCQEFLCHILVMLLSRYDPQASPYVAEGRECMLSVGSWQPGERKKLSPYHPWSEGLVRRQG